MHNLPSFRRAICLAAMLGSLAIGAALPARATDTLDTHGFWASVVDTDKDGNRICGVRTHMETGGEFRLLVIGGRIHLVAYDRRWNMTTDATVDTKIAIDDTAYRGEATAIDGQTLLVMGLSRNFLADFMEGDVMVADFGGVHWDINLAGSAQATADMAACVAAAGSDLTS